MPAKKSWPHRMTAKQCEDYLLARHRLTQKARLLIWKVCVEGAGINPAARQVGVGSSYAHNLIHSTEQAPAAHKHKKDAKGRLFCPKCGEFKSSKEFPLAGRDRSLRAQHCRDCCRERQNQRLKDKQSKAAGLKECPCCGEFKDPSEFVISKGNRTWASTRCVDCAKKGYGRWRKAEGLQVRPETTARKRALRIRSTIVPYLMTEQEYQDLIALRPIISAQSKDILHRVRVEGQNMCQVAEAFGLTHQRVHQIANFKAVEVSKRGPGKREVDDQGRLRCSCCGEFKEPSEFLSRPQSATGYSRRCVTCLEKHKKPRKPREPRPVRKKLPVGSELCCPRCKTTKDVSEFNRNRASVTGYSSYCKACTRVYTAERNARLATGAPPPRKQLAALKAKLQLAQQKTVDLGSLLGEIEAGAHALTHS